MWSGWEVFQQPVNLTLPVFLYRDPSSVKPTTIQNGNKLREVGG